MSCDFNVPSWHVVISNRELGGKLKMGEKLKVNKNSFYDLPVPRIERYFRFLPAGPSRRV
jgi:hypothetical protein